MRGTAWEHGSADHGTALVPAIPFDSCPIRATLGVLGRKWACMVLRDVAFFGEMTFTRILRNNPGMTPRILSMRLRDLQEEGLIERLAPSRNPKSVRYRLTVRGRDAIPILTGLIQYGMRHHPEEVFPDREPRTLAEVFPGAQRRLLGPLMDYLEE